MSTDGIFDIVIIDTIRFLEMTKTVKAKIRAPEPKIMIHKGRQLRDEHPPVKIQRE
jgi:hypothetical protein